MKDLKLTRSFAAALQGATRSVNTTFQPYQAFGKIDPTKPPENRQRRDYTSTFFMCLDLRAKAIADAMSRCYVEREVGQQEFAPVENAHPWFRLIQDANEFQSAYEMWMFISENVDLTGHADFLVEYSGTRPASLLPIYQEFGEVYPQPDARGGIGGWTFYRIGGSKLNLRAQDVVRLRRPSPFSPYESMSLIEAARYETNTANVSRVEREKDLREGGITSDMVTTDQPMTAQQRTELGQSLKGFIGERGKGNVLVFSHGMKPIQRLSSRDMEFLQGEIQNREQILEICGVPKALWENVTTRATAITARFVFVENTIKPACSLYSDQVTTQFNKIFGADRGALQVRFPNIIPVDHDFMLKEREVQLRTGQRTINDFLKEDGFAEIPEGNGRYIQFGLEDLTKPAPAPIVPPPPPDETEEGELMIRRRAVRYDTEEKRAEAWRNIDRKKKRQAAMLKPVVRGYAEWVQEQIEKNVRGSERAILTQEKLFDIAEAEQELLERLTPEVLRVLQAGFANGLELGGISGLEFSINNPRVRQALMTIMEKQASIPVTMHNEISDRIKDLIESQRPTSEITATIREYFDTYTEGRVNNISNGLATTTWETGQHEAYVNAGIESQQWLSQRDGSVRDSHIAADGQTVDINKAFQLVGGEVRYPGDPDGPIEETIGCRCSTLPL